VRRPRRASGNLQTFVGGPQHDADGPLQEVTPEQLADDRAKISKLPINNTDFFLKVVAVKHDLKASAPPGDGASICLDATQRLRACPARFLSNLGCHQKGVPLSKKLRFDFHLQRPDPRYVANPVSVKEGSYEGNERCA